MVNYSSPEINGSIQNNAMYIRSNNKASAAGEKNAWKMVFDDEARKVNPLFDVKMKRNDLILQSVETNDWSKYNEFESKQHPAWYEEVNGKQMPNKVYYGNLIESKIEALKEAKMSGDQEEVDRWESNLQEAIQDFKNAPGIVPYIVGLNHNAGVAAEYGVEEPSDDYFDSPYNSSLVLNQGKFEENMWYDNAVFKEDTELKEHVEAVVAETFPTSSTTPEPVQNAEPKEKSVDLKEQDEALNKQTVAAASTLEATNEAKETSSFDVQAAYLQTLKNLQESIKPSLQEALDKYKYA
jgi:hypothetical protein